jgi:hypothetical protein
MQRYQVIAAVTWRIVAELMRRHHQAFQLRVVELHPKAENQDCIGIFQQRGDFPGTPLCYLNQAGDIHIQIKTSAKVQARIEHYVDAYLASEDPREIVEKIESALELPDFRDKLLPSTTPPVLVFRLIAGLLERFALSRERLEVRCGGFDNPEESGAFIRGELTIFPDISERIGKKTIEGETRAEAASSYWLLYQKPSRSKAPKLFGVFDIKGRLYAPENPRTHRDLYREFEESDRDILPLLNEMEGRLRS